MLTHLRIHWKLTLLSLIFLVPICFLAILFIKQSNQDISSAKKEMAGAHYMDVLREIELLVASDNFAAATAQLPALEDSNALLGSEMGLNLSANIENIAKAILRSDRDKASSLESLRVILELAVQIGDRSNLLNTDKTIYYNINADIVKLPLLTQQAIVVYEAAKGLLVQDKPALANLVDFQVKLVQINTTLDSISLLLTAAHQGENDDAIMHKFDIGFEQFRAAAKSYVGALEEIGKNAATGNTSAHIAIADLSRLKMMFLEHDKNIWELSSKELEHVIVAHLQELERKLYLSLGATGMVVLIALVLAMRICRSIRKPITDLVAVMKQMAQGDMTVQVQGSTRRDEVGMLARAAEDMQKNLHSLATEVRYLSEQVNRAVKDITDSVSGQAASTSQMSASVAQITSTVEELSSSSTQIAENSHAVVNIAKLTHENSIKGQHAMTEVADKTAEIQNDNQNSLHEILELARCSKEIAKVMEIINTVADQTKLIAFNAALEAAGAGDAGRRFGVVASEIRRLADSVTESTGEIERRINQIQEAINRLAVTSEKGVNTILAGIESASHTRDSLSELVEAARQSSSAAQQISLSTQQQKTASSQVVIALREIVSASTHTAQSINCISEISIKLARLSYDLEQVLKRFKLRPAE